MQLLRDLGDGEDLGDRLQRVDVGLPETFGRRETTFSVPTARPRDTSGTSSADLNPEVSRMFASRKSGAAVLDVVDDHRLAGRDDLPIAVRSTLKTISGRGRLRRSSSCTRAV